MRLIIPALVLACAASSASAAVSLDVDVAALREAPGNVAIRAAAAEQPFFPRLAAAAAAAAAQSGHDPRQTVRRIQVQVDDDGAIGVIIVGVPAASAAERLAAIAPRAQTRILAEDTLAIGVAGTTAPTTVPEPQTGPGMAVVLHATPRPHPLLPLMAKVRWCDLRSDGAGHVHATIQAWDPAGASAIQARLISVRDNPPALLQQALPVEAAPALSAMQVTIDQYDSTRVEVALEVPVEARIAGLRMVSERIRARVQ